MIRGDNIVCSRCIRTVLDSSCVRQAIIGAVADVHGHGHGHGIISNKIDKNKFQIRVLEIRVDRVLRVIRR